MGSSHWDDTQNLRRPPLIAEDVKSRDSFGARSLLAIRLDVAVEEAGGGGSRNYAAQKSRSGVLGDKRGGPSLRTGVYNYMLSGIGCQRHVQ